MESNTPYEFEDLGIKYKYSGPANKSDDRKFRELFSEFPKSPQDADMAMNIIKKNKKPRK